MHILYAHILFNVLYTQFKNVFIILQILFLLFWIKKTTVYNEIFFIHTCKEHTAPHKTWNFFKIFSFTRLKRLFFLFFFFSFLFFLFFITFLMSYMYDHPEAYFYNKYIYIYCFIFSNTNTHSNTRV